jgi:polysaccharide pyruvyl transferase WcaK-like protein
MFVKRKMYLSHLASFQGNIGDIASQRAFRAWFESLFPDFEITWQNLEIRKFFRNTNYKWKKMQKELTDSDCLIIGGGNFLELWPENSPTGTSLPFSIPEIESITIPIFMNSVGVDDGQGIGKAANENFGDFINYFANRRSNFLSVRNDGSFNVIKTFLSPGNWVKCYEIPDHAFFTEWRNGQRTHLSSKFIVGINLAIDMERLRFKSFDNNPEKFLKKFAITLNGLCSEYDELEIRLIPHMYSDIKAFAVLLENMQDEYRRERVTMSHLDCRENSEVYLEAYSGLNGLISMRFHSHVFGIANRIPLFSLNSYSQINKLLENYGLERIDNYDFREEYEKLESKLASFVHSLNDGKNGFDGYQQFLIQIEEKREMAGRALRDWLIREIR